MFASLCSGDALYLHDKLNVFASCQYRDKVVCLKNKTNLLQTQLCQFTFAQCVNAAFPNPHFTTVWYIESANGVQERGLATTGRRRQAHEVARLDFDDLVLSARTWYRLPEDDEDDDNPHMHRYYGYGEVRGTYAPNKNTFSAMFRPGTDKNSVELTWSYPITDYLRLYTQYFNGYGESLLDYNARTERIGIGVALNDFLQR